MKRIVYALYILTIVLLGAATLVEHQKGSTFVATHVYHTWWFTALWAVLSLLLLYTMAKARLWKRLSVAMLHLSFVVILAGGLTTFLTSEKGYVHLTPGSTVASFTDQDDATAVRPLPFRITLERFTVKCYPGTDAPQDYVSSVSLSDASGSTERVDISMNRIYTRQGYRFYQSSYDADGKGSWLSVNYDPWGTGLSYFGYVLLALSMLSVLFSRKEEFLRLLRHPLLRKSSLILLLLLGSSFQAHAVRSLPAYSRERADSLAPKQIIYNDRVAPFNTMARDFLLKLTGRTTYGGLSPEQVITGWLFRPDTWQYEPMIQVKNAELRQRLGLSSEKARFVDFFDAEGNYRLMGLVDNQGGMGAAQSPFQKAVQETDEKVGVILMLQNGTLFRPLPKDGSVERLSDARVSAELLYNRLPLTKILFMANLLFGFLSFGLLLYSGRQGRRTPKSERVVQRLTTASRFAMWLSFAAMAFTYALRWYIAGRVPLSNGYETMLFLALATIVFALVMHRRFPVMMPFGFLLCGFTLLVSHLGQMNPQITPLVPVLLSPWLSVHVSFVMMSYALLAFIMLNGITGLCLPRESERLMLLSRLLLYPAVFTLGIGIFLGAVWANQSWGSYWSWDSKEVWALITFMVYAVAFHSQSIPALRRPRTFHAFAVAAFLAVLMTYVGVNYFLTGMHSYA